MAHALVVPLALAVGGGVLYHYCAKSVPSDLPPGPVLVVAYAAALLLSGVVHVLTMGAPAAVSTRLLHPAILGLGAGAALIEFGYVQAYRAAWPVSIASVIVNGTVAALLVLVGIAVFGERLSTTRVLGVLLCLAGVWLLRR